MQEWIKTLGTFQSEDVVQIRKAFYLIPKIQQELIKSIHEEPFSAGLLLGVQDKLFRPTPALLERIDTDAVINLDHKSAWLFVCGRDVFEESIQNAMRKPVAIVKNHKGEVLGLAKKTGNTYKNIFDIGKILRT